MPISSILMKGGCDILNYMVTTSDHQCTNDGGHFMLLANQYIEDPYNGVLLCNNHSILQ